MISLKPVELKFPTMDFPVYNPSDNSSSIHKLQDALFNREQQQYDVGNKYVDFCKMLGEINLNLYPDKDIAIWYRDYQTQVCSDIESNYKCGNYQTASRLIDEKIRQISTDPFLLCRLEASENYKNAKQYVISNYSGTILSEWWFDTHPFFYEDCVDENGKLIGYKSTDLTLPVDDFPWIDHILFVRDNVLVNKKYTQEVGGNLFDQFCLNNNDFFKLIEQSYKVSVWYYQRELTSNNSYSANYLSSQRKLLMENDSLITPREFYIRKLNVWLLR